MRIELGNWTIEKARNGKETDKVVPVRMIANRLDIDKENQQILPQAFNKETVENFIREGIIDWHHQSVIGETPKDRAYGIIGKPYDFKWENDLPIVYGNLTKSHPIVKEAILPHLEADQKVFCASVGGNIKKARNVIDMNTHKPTEQVLAINWNHIAIAGSPYVISSGSEVSLVKAKTGESEVLVRYADVSAFEKEYDFCMKGDEIRKALEIGAGTDSAELTGMDALRQQSKRKKDSHIELIKQVMKGLKNNSIGGSENGVRVFLKSNGYSENEIEDFLTKFRKNINDLKNQ